MRMFVLIFYFVIILLYIVILVEMLGEVMNVLKYGNFWFFEFFLYFVNVK